MTDNNIQTFKHQYLASLTDAKVQLDADVREFLRLQSERNALESDFVSGHLCDESEEEFEDSCEILGAHIEMIKKRQVALDTIIERIVRNPAHLTWML